MILAQRN